MSQKVPLIVRVEPSTKKSIENLAKRDGRSLGQYVERVILAHLAQVKSRAKRTET